MAGKKLLRYLAERKSILMIGFLIMLVATVPYLVGYACQGEDWQFTGFLIGVEDGNSYIAKMQSGADGSWLFRSPYSTESQAGALAFLPYLLLGKLAAGAAQHEQLVALFHLYRISGGILAALAIYDFVSLFLQNELRRRWAVIVILLGGGLGWIVAAAGWKNFLGSVPLDFISPESFGFLGLLSLPHLLFARALLFWGVCSYLRKESGIPAGFLWLAVGFFQPMFAVIAWIVVGFHSLAELLPFRRSASMENQGWSFRSSYLSRALVAVLISSPMVIYTVVVFYHDPYLAAWTAQNYLPSPHWVHYLIAYGLVLPLAVGGAVKILRSRPDLGTFLACWMVVTPVLISIPVTTQRRFAEGIWIILITAAFGFFSDKTRLPTYGKIVLGLIFPTAVFLLWGAGSRAARPAEPVFLPADQVLAYQALADLAPRNSIVLAAFETGNSLPAWVPVRVVLGHGPETVRLSEWQADLDNYFLLNQGEENCGGFFADSGIDYLFWGPREGQEWDWDPGIKKCLRQVYNSDSYRIYEVNK